MGLTNSSDNTNNEQEQDWKNFLSNTNQDRSRVYSSQQNQLTEFNPQEYQKQTNIKEEKVHKNEINTYIAKDIHSEGSQEKINCFEFEVLIESKQKKPFSVNVYFWAVQNVDQEGNYHGINYQQKLPQQKFEGNPIEKLKIEFDINNIDLDRFNNFQASNSPLIIEIHEQNLISVYVYNLNHKDMFKPLLLNKGVIINKKYIMIRHVYGLNTNDQNKDSIDSKCVICFDNDKNTIINPCNHMCLCEECSKDYIKNSTICPICRQKIDSFSKLVIDN